MIDMRADYLDGGSQILWEDGERVFRRRWRLDDNGKRSVLLVMPAADQPSRSILDHLTHEYDLKDELDGAWAVRPLDLVQDGGRTVLVLDDVGVSRSISCSRSGPKIVIRPPPASDPSGFIE